MRPALAALLLLGAGCSFSDGIPVVGDLVPSAEKENARIQRQNVLYKDTHKPEWQSLCDAGKFKSALAYLEAHRGDIGDAHASQATEDTHRQCRVFLSDRLSRFRRYLGDLKSQSELAAMKPDDFAAVFNLPSPEELLSTTPAYDWARAHYPNLEDFRSRRPSGEGLLKAVAEASALPPDEDGGSRWFDVLESLVFRAMSDTVLADVAAMQEATRAQRLVAKARLESLQTKWLALLKAVDEKHRLKVAEHEGLIFRPMEEMPKDLAELDAVDISACLSAAQPEAELRRAEKTLKNLEGRPGITRESRQKLYSLVVTAVSLRTFLAGKEEAD